MTVKMLGHPVHQQIIVFPVGLLATGFIFDAIDLLGGSSVFGTVGFYNIAAGLIGVVVAAAFGLLDWAGIPSGTRAKKLGIFHAATNTVVAVLFLISLLARIGADDRQPTWGLFLLELVGAALLGASGWMGGELVDRHGIGVHPGANVDAPSSLSGRPATEGSGART